jgi:lysophospholipase L1-like esterase
VVCALGAVTHCSGHGPGPTPVPTLKIVCPSNISVRTDPGLSTATVMFNVPTTSGGKPPVTTSCTAKSGDSLTPGSWDVNCSASDAQGHTAACTFNVTVEAAPRLTATRFMAFGDSLTEGKVSIVPQFTFPTSYTIKLTSMLQTRYTDQNLTIFDEGEGGDEAEKDVDRFDQRLNADHPQVVLLMEGSNDVGNHGDDGVDPAIGALGTMGSHAAGKGAFVFLATVPPMKPDHAGAASVTSLNAKIAALASSRAWPLVDVYAAFNGDLGLIGADGLHPTDAGYQVVAQAFYDRIVARLEAQPATR